MNDERILVTFPLPDPSYLPRLFQRLYSQYETAISAERRHKGPFHRFNDVLRAGLLSLLFISFITIVKYSNPPAVLLSIHYIKSRLKIPIATIPTMQRNHATQKSQRISESSKTRIFEYRGRAAVSCFKLLRLPTPLSSTQQRSTTVSNGLKDNPVEEITATII